jgi:hypothetical protein
LSSNFTRFTGVPLISRYNNNDKILRPDHLNPQANTVQADKTASDDSLSSNVGITPAASNNTTTVDLLYQMMSLVSLLTESLGLSAPSKQPVRANNTVPPKEESPASSKTSPASKVKNGTANDAINWGSPVAETEAPNGAYQVPGGFAPPKGNEKADAAPGIMANPGTIQNADSPPDDSKSHSQAAGTKEKHSMAQVDAMYGDIVDKQLAKYNAKYGTNAPRQVILGIIYQESQGDPNTFGTDDPAQSRGLMQVTADNAAREFPGKNQYNPEVSIETGVEAFTRTLAQYDGNLSQALAAYNQGKATTTQGKAYAEWVKLWASQVPE